MINSQPGWMQVYTNSLEGGNKYVLILEGAHFAIIKNPGGSYASGQSRQYGKTQYTLIEKGKGYWAHKDKNVWTGRLTKEGKQVIKEALETAEKERQNENPRRN